MTSGYDGKPISLHEPGYDCDANGKCDTWDPGTPLEPLFTPGSKFRYWDEAEIELGYAITLLGGNPNYVCDLLMTHSNTIECRISHGKYRNDCRHIAVMNGGLKTSARIWQIRPLNRGNWNGRQLISSSCR
jgi:hypothetical protein